MSNPLQATPAKLKNPFDACYEDEIAVVKKTAVPLYKRIQSQMDHSEARQIYEQYKVKARELAKRQEYAKRVVAATGDSRGMTPVLPLATMGCNGGPLLCDHCLKPIVLEGGKYHKVYADVAWSRATLLERDGLTPWVSYISGGMLVEIVENGTLRIYHGYSRPGQCDYIAKQERTAADAAFKHDFSKANLIWKFLDQDLLKDQPDSAKNELLGKIMLVMFSFDPGLGANHE